jgi:signal transduction histidine kinase
VTACARARRASASGHGARQAFAQRLVPYLLTVAVLAVVARPLAAVVAFLWGLALAGELARRVVEPELQRRFVEREAARGLRRAVPRERRSLGEEHTRELGALFAAVADGIRDPLRAAQGLVRQMGEAPDSPHNADHARLALGELDRVERSVAQLLRFARQSALERSAAGELAQDGAR